ncbi:hypothetical protein L3i20_v209490 [Paenibacillus sp. L3-i20]|nr:hypothetical protein L3i20_v209490 [Paenibacillus sp. L3-i20]
MNIRLLRQEDERYVAGIMSGYSLQFPPFVVDRYPQRWSNFLQDASRCAYYVATTDSNEVTGHAGFLFNEEVGLYEIVGVAVSNSYQRHGIGKRLIYTICNKLQEFGANAVILYTLGHTGTEDTLTFYRSIGFEMLDYEKDYFETSFDRVTFVKTL